MDDHGPAQPTDLTLQSTAPGTGQVCAAMVIMGPRVDIRMKNEMLVIDKPHRAMHWQKEKQSPKQGYYLFSYLLFTGRVLTQN